MSLYFYSVVVYEFHFTEFTWFSTIDRHFLTTCLVSFVMRLPFPSIYSVFFVIQWSFRNSCLVYATIKDKWTLKKKLVENWFKLNITWRVSCVGFWKASTFIRLKTVYRRTKICWTSYNIKRKRTLNVVISSFESFT